MSRVSVIQVVPGGSGGSGSGDSEKGGGAGNSEKGAAGAVKGSEKHKRSRKSYKGIKEENKIEKSNQRPVVSQKMRIVQESIGSSLGVQ